MDLQGRQAAVVGIGISNLKLIHHLLEKGVTVTACDRKTREDLGQRAEELERLGVPLSTGAGYLDPLTTHDLIFLTPGMPKHLPEILAAQVRGATVAGEIGLVLAACQAPVIGITGSAGKTTTTTLIGEILKAAGFEVHVGGNIGTPLIDRVQSIPPDAKVVLELSSFQLQLTGLLSPQIAVITNLSPNHLDIHSSMDEYVQAKQNIYRHQRSPEAVILNHDDLAVRAFAADASGRVVFFSRLVDPGTETCAFVREEDMVWRYRGQEYPTLKTSEIKLLGLHNQENALAAMAAAYLAGAGMHAIRSVLTTFAGVEHRLEPVRVLNGVVWYNDSKATSPTEAVAAIITLPKPLLLIAGGSDKGIPFNPMAEAVAAKVKTLILTGPTAPRIEAAALQAGYCGDIFHEIDLSGAVHRAWAEAVSGDTVVLAPGCASFDAYRNFEERGHHFKRLVNELS